jgi:hypothetical protein
MGATSTSSLPDRQPGERTYARSDLDWSQELRMTTSRASPDMRERAATFLGWLTAALMAVAAIALFATGGV